MAEPYPYPVVCGVMMAPSGRGQGFKYEFGPTIVEIYLQSGERWCGTVAGKCVSHRKHTADECAEAISERLRAIRAGIPDG